MERVNVVLDESCRETFEKFPRRISASSIIRCLVKAAGTPNEKDWEHLLETEPDLKKARDAIKEYLKSTGRKTIAL